MTDDLFARLIDRVRAGEEAACAELAERFGPQLRRVVRVRLREPLLQSRIDTVDICQSVLMNFFARARLGQFDLDSPEALTRLLVTMARNKFLNQVRYARVRRQVSGAHGDHRFNLIEQVPDQGESPSAVATGAELLERARSRLTPDELSLAELRKAGHDWDEVARRTGSTPEACRKRLARALDRVLESLGLGAGGKAPGS